MQNPPFYNTIKLNGADLDRAKTKASSQQGRILAFFVDHPLRLYTPEDVLKKAFGDGVCINYVRRAISNLTREGWLEKTEHRKIGDWGKPVFFRRLAAPRHKHTQRGLFP